ncbi:MAG: hypothetical protein EOO15_20075 [Chitinophagaceae bacterium]|nr:MAG: hypothetical protein EOO15_20075 [Chitinophagaceae bacterium]
MGVAAIDDFFVQYPEYVWSKDAAALVRLYDAQAVLFDMWDEGFQLDPSAWAKTIVDWLGGLGEERVKVSFDMLRIRRSADTAFASALVQFQALSKEGAVLRSMKNRMTLVFSKSEDRWKVLHQHTSAPIRSDSLTAIFDL